MKLHSHCNIKLNKDDNVDLNSIEGQGRNKMLR